MLSAHFGSGLLLQVGPRFLIPLMPNKSNLMGGLNIRLGYLEFRP